MNLSAEIESLRHAVMVEDFSTVRYCCHTLSSALAARLMEHDGITEDMNEVEQEVADFFDWARCALLCSRSQIEYRIRNAAAASAYGTEALPHHTTLIVDA
jgi:hypothetical protein